MLLLQESDLRGLVPMADAIDAMEQAFLALAEERAVLPPPVSLDIPAVRGEVHVKGAFLGGDEPEFVFKVASGFYLNPDIGLGSGSGLMLAFDARTGYPVALLLDNAYLTDVRTGAAGGLAARLLAAERVPVVTVVGAGVQARMQLRALAAVRELEQVRVWNRHPERAATCAREMAAELGAEVTAEADLDAALSDAAVVITVTPAREPLVRADQLARGCLVIAVGSDGPDKQELTTEVLSRADLVVADRLEQCERLGEIHHALAAGVLDRDSVVELGALVAGAHQARVAADQLVVADLTGVGVQDAAIAAVALRRARGAGLGTKWPT